MLNIANKEKLAYIIGVALGDGNLSNPNGRAVRLRISCDKKYPDIIREIAESLKIIAPNNKVSFINRPPNCIDVSCYSNGWEELLGWKAKNGPKHTQKISVPEWIKNDNQCAINCLRGLIQTDGCIYNDRGYLMVNFVNCCESLAYDAKMLIEKIGFRANMQIHYYKEISKLSKYTVRVTRKSGIFLNTIGMSSKK